MQIKIKSKNKNKNIVTTDVCAVFTVICQFIRLNLIMNSHFLTQDILLFKQIQKCRM